MRAEDLHNIQKIYMIGIGGIGMSALARYFLKQGKSVAGYDRMSTRLTDDLIREGSDIHFTADLAFIKENYPDTGNLLVIYTPAVPDDHLELEFFRKGGYQVIKRARVLGILASRDKSIAIAGTHGKTTVATMLTHLMKSAGIPCNAFLGGVSKNYNTNAVLSGEEGWLVLEADEFDRSFLNLFPDMAVITSCDPDHLDIYGTEEELQRAFCQFVSQVKPGGTLVLSKGLKLGCLDGLKIETFSYAMEGAGDYQAGNIRYEEGYYNFDVSTPEGPLMDIRLGVPGLINVENALAVISLSRKLGVDDNVLRESLATFTGVARRFDVRIHTPELVYIDDYAHHPRELEAFIDSVRRMHPGKKLTGVFQPHLYSRTRDFAPGFAASLEKLDELIMLDIYPAREIPIKGITSGTIFDRVRLEKKILIGKDQLLGVLEQWTPQVLLTMGAGDIDQLVEPIIGLYQRKKAS